MSLSRDARARVIHRASVRRRLRHRVDQLDRNTGGGASAAMLHSASAIALGAGTSRSEVDASWCGFSRDRDPGIPANRAETDPATSTVGPADEGDQPIFLKVLVLPSFSTLPPALRNAARSPSSCSRVRVAVCLLDRPDLRRTALFLLLGAISLHLNVNGTKLNEPHRKKTSIRENRPVLGPFRGRWTPYRVVLRLCETTRLCRRLVPSRPGQRPAAAQHAYRARALQRPQRRLAQGRQ